MAIPVSQFPILSFEQANPALAGVKYGTDIYGDILKNYQQQTQNQYLPQTLQAQLALAQAQTPNLQAQTQKLQQEMPYYGQKMAGDIQEALARSQLYGQQAKYTGPDILSQVALRGAEAKKDIAEIPKLQVEAQTLPYTALGQYYGGLGRLGMAQYNLNPNTAFARILNTPALESLGSSNPAMAKQISQAIAGMISNTNQRGQQGLGVGGGGFNISGLNAGPEQQQADQQTIAGMLSRAGVQSPQMTQSLMNQPSNLTGPIQQPQQQLSQMISQAMQQPTIAPTQQQAQQAGATPKPGQPGKDMYGLDENDYKTMQTSLSDALEKRTTTANIMNQRQYGNILEGLFQSGNELMPSVAKYAGFLGKGKGSLDSIKSSLGETSQDYSDYLKFTRTLAPNVANELVRVLGKNATDQQEKVTRNIADPTYWDSNPQQAMEQWRYLVNLYRTKVDPALANNPSQSLANLKNINVNKTVTSGAQQSQVSQKGMTRMVSPDGATGWIPNEKVQDALTAGAKLAK